MLSALLALFCSSTFGLTDVAETEEHEGGSWTGVTVEHSQDMRGRTNGVGIAGAGTHSFSLGYDGYGRPASSTSSGFAGGGVTSVELLVRGTLAGAGHNGTDAVADKQVWVAVPAASKSFSYDGAGRLTGDSNWVYDWDARGHLMGMTRKAGTSADPQVTAEALNFTYDADGRRVCKVHTVSFQNAPDQVSDSKMLWDGWLPLMEQRTVNGVAKPKRWFVWGRDVSGDWDGAGGVGGLAAIIEEGGRALLPVDDGLGNIMALVSAGSGNVVAKYDHGPYGEVWGSEGETDASPFRYQGKLYDAETGLYYFGYRYYSPKMGRWLSRDPLGEAGGFNLYAYCGNDPVNNWDYLGMEGYSFEGHAQQSIRLQLFGILEMVNIYAKFQNAQKDAYTQQLLTAGSREERKALQAKIADLYDDSVVSRFIISGADVGTSTQTAAATLDATVDGAYQLGLMSNPTAGFLMRDVFGIQDVRLLRNQGYYEAASAEEATGNLYSALIPSPALGKAPAMLVRETQSVSSGSKIWQWLNRPVFSRQLAAKTPMFSSNLGSGGSRASAELLNNMRAHGRTITIATEGSEELRFLNAVGAEASVGGPGRASIILRENPSKVGAMEEFLHGTQERLGIIERRGIQGAEDHVADFMERHRRLLGLDH